LHKSKIFSANSKHSNAISVQELYCCFCMTQWLFLASNSSESINKQFKWIRTFNYNTLGQYLLNWPNWIMWFLWRFQWCLLKSYSCTNAYLIMHMDNQNTLWQLNTCHKQNLFNMFELYIESPHICNVQLKHVFNCLGNVTKLKSPNLLRILKIHPW